jgi:signal transduction histidine kinase/CheY-like chemotaxis protein
MPMRWTMDSERAAVLLAVLLVLVAVVASLVTARLERRRVTRMARTLIERARGLAAGDGAVPPARSGDELATLGEQLDGAVAERRRVEAAVDVRQRRIQALAEVNLSLSRQLDLGRLLQQITAALAQLTGARTVVLWNADHGGQALTRRAHAADESVSSVDLPHALTFGQGGAGWIARNRQPLFVEDIADDPRIMAVDWALRHGLVAFAGVPVLAGDELLGVLTLNLVRGALPQGDDRALLSFFAAQAAVAIRNAQLFAEVDARRRTAETLGDLGRTLAQALDSGVVAERIADNVRSLLGVQTFALFRLEGESGDLVPLVISGDAGPGFDHRGRLPAGAGVAGLAVQHRRAVATQNLLTDPRVDFAPEARARIESASLRAVLAVPLLVRETVIGALAVSDREGRVFDEDEIRLAQAFADQAALALDNARLYEETAQRLRHLDSLREVVEQILVPVSLEERLNVISRKTAELFGADRVIIALRDDERHELVVRAGYSLAEHEMGRVVRAGALGMAAARRAGVLVNGYASWPHRDPYIVDAYAHRPAEAVIGVPLLIRDQVIGGISVGLHAPGKRFGQADLDRLASLAVPAALAIEHSRLYDELAARLRELQDTQAQLLQAGKLSAVGQLVSGVAHELNNPLSVVIGYGQLLRSRELPAEVRRPIELIVSQGDRMARIVQSLLLFSRQRKPERGAVNVAQAIEQTIGLRATQLMLSGIRVETDLGGRVPAVEGDAHQLQQVFLNLLLNAEQAILGGGVGERRVGDVIRVSVAARADGAESWVAIRVADNGPGIPADVLPRIFEPFFTTKKVGEGTGLGLSVSYGIVQQHAGRLTVESRPGRTVFILDLPAMTRTAPRGAGVVAGSATGAGRGRLSLVVDDEEAVAELVATLLRQAGWNVDVATGGRAGLDCLRRARYDLVVSDIRMPDGSGESLYREAIAGDGGLAARFVFMTGDTANPEAWRFLQQTRAHVVEKPFTAQALLSAIERITA